ncbi:MAG: hypothetical protein ACKVVP_20200 [Chloroflexota bacterium]
MRLPPRSQVLVLSRIAILGFLLVLLLVLGLRPAGAVEFARCDVREGWTRITTIAPPYDPSGNLAERYWWYASIAEVGEEGPVLYAAPTFVGLARSDFCGRHWSGPLFQDPRVSLPGFDWRINWFVDSARLVVVESGGRLHVVISGTRLNTTSDDAARTWRPTGRVIEPGIPESSAATLEAVGFSRTVPGRGYARVGARAGRVPGLFAHTDDGIHWHVIRPGLRAGSTTRLLVDPDSDIVYGFYQTTLHRLIYRNGVTQTDEVATFDSEITATALSVDGSRFFAATAQHGLFQSPDRGVTWTPVAGPAEVGYWMGESNQRAQADAARLGFWRGLEVSRFDPPVLYGISGDGDFWIYREPSPAP